MDFDFTARGQPRVPAELPSEPTWTEVPVPESAALSAWRQSVWLSDDDRVRELTSRDPGTWRQYEGFNALAGVSYGRPWLFRGGGQTVWRGRRKAFRVRGRIGGALALDDRILVVSGPERARVTR